MPTRVQVSWHMLLEPLSVKTLAIPNQVCTRYHPQNEGKYLEVSLDVFLKKKKYSKFQKSDQKILKWSLLEGEETKSKC